MIPPQIFDYERGGSVGKLANAHAECVPTSQHHHFPSDSNKSYMMVINCIIDRASTGKVGIPARGQLNRRGKRFFFPCTRSRPINLVSRDGFGLPVPRQLGSFSTLRLNLLLPRGPFFLLPLSVTMTMTMTMTTTMTMTASIHLLYRQSPSGHAIAYRRNSLSASA